MSMITMGCTISSPKISENYNTLDEIDYYEVRDILQNMNICQAKKHQTLVSYTINGIQDEQNKPSMRTEKREILDRLWCICEQSPLLRNKTIGELLF